MIRTSTLLSFLGAWLAFAAALPWPALDRPASAQQPAPDDRFAERDRSWDQALELLAADKLREAIAEGERVLALERQLLGSDDPEVAVTLAWLGIRYQEVEDFEAARRALEKSFNLRKDVLGPKDWRTVDAAWELRHLATVAALPKEDLREVLRVERAEREMLRQIDRGELQPAIKNAADIQTVREKLLPSPDLDLFDSLSSVAYLLGALGEPGAARVYYDQAVRMCDMMHPADLCPRGSPQMGACLAEVAELCLEYRDYAAALDYSERALAAYERFYPEDLFPNGHPDLAAALDTLALAKSEAGDLAASIASYERALDIRERLYPADRFPRGHRDVALTLNYLGQVHELRGDTAMARRFYDRSLAMFLNLYPADEFPQSHPDLAIIYNNLGVFLSRQAEYTEARKYQRLALDVYERTYPADEYPDGHPELAAALNNLGVLLSNQGDDAAARDYFERALTMLQRLHPGEIYPEGHPSLASGLNSLGMVLQNVGDYAEAQRYLEQALAMRERLYPAETYPQGHDHIATSLDNLGGLHHSRGDFARARDYYERALAMRRELYPADEYPDGHLDIAFSLNNLARLLAEHGDLDAAIKLYQESITICLSLFPPETHPNGHPYLATSYGNLASLLDSGGELEWAGKFYAKALETNERLYPAEQFPDGHPDLALSLNNMGAYCVHSGELDAAREYFERALAVYERMYPEERYALGHPELAKNLNNIAYVLHAQGDLAGAKRRYERMLAIYEALYPREQFPDGHPELAICLYNLSTVLGAEGDFTQALALVDRAAEMELAALHNVFSVSAEQSMRNYLGQQAGSVDVVLTLAGLTAGAHPSDDVLRTVLERKTALGDALLELRRLQRLATDDRDVAAQVAELQRLRQQAADLALRPATDDVVHTRGELTQRANQLEAKLFRHLSGKAARSSRPAVDVESVESLRAQLGSDAALIEIVRYAPYNYQPRDDNDRWLDPHYAALVLRGGKDGPVTLVDLGPAESIDSLVGELRNNVSSAARELRMADEQELETEYRKAARKLSDAVIAPLADALGDAKRWYVSPDRELAKVPFEALLDNDDRYLVESRDIAYLSSGIDLLDEVAASTRRGTVVFAAPDYQLAADSETPSDELLARLDAEKSEAYRGPLSGDVRGFSWSPLPATLEEARQIERLLSDNAAYGPVVVVTGPDALEGALKQMAAPRILHLATHGFYLPDQKRAKTDDSGPAAPPRLDSPPSAAGRMAALGDMENPLLRSGIILAGANHQADRADGSPPADDGWLTAEEIGLLDLSGAELVVLSACETGLGDIRNGEGVSGLRRAFLHAGAQTLITSLYKVPDQATQELMTAMYARLAAGDSKQAALRSAQRTVIARRRDQHGAAHPFFWASFILVGDPGR